MCHPFFDELRQEGAKMPNGKEFPPLFDFTREGKHPSPRVPTPRLCSEMKLTSPAPAPARLLRQQSSRYDRTSCGSSSRRTARPSSRRATSTSTRLCRYHWSSYESPWTDYPSRGGGEPSVAEQQPWDLVSFLSSLDSSVAPRSRRTSPLCPRPVLVLACVWSSSSSRVPSDRARCVVSIQLFCHVSRHACRYTPHRRLSVCRSYRPGAAPVLSYIS